MGRKIAGTVYIKADSEQMTVTGGVEYVTSDPQRDPIEQGGGDYTEIDVNPYITFTATNDPDLDENKLRTADDLAITAELANGKTFVLTGAYWSGEKLSSSTDGTTAYTFHGVKGVLL